MKAIEIANRAAGTTNITGTYSELIAATAQEAHFVLPAFTANANLIIGIGAAAAEVDHVLIAGGSSTAAGVPCHIPKGARVSIKTLAASTISAGNFGFTFFQ